MAVDRRTERGIPVFTPSGELDEEKARELCSQLQEMAVKGGERALVDFSQVPFVQSAGIGVMFSCLSLLRGHCRLGFAGLDENIGRVLDRVGFLEVQGLCFYSDLEQALHAFSADRG